MSGSDPVARVAEDLGRASRRAALLSLLGFVAVLAAIGYAAFQLKTLERQRVALLDEQAVLVNQQTVLREETEEYRASLAIARTELTTARASLAAARAAINAFHAGRLEDAVRLYDEALATDPANPYLQNLRAYSLFRLGRVDAAVDGQQQSLAVDPNYAWGYFDLARFLCAASPPRVEDAKEAAAKAIELRPDMRGIMQGDGEFQRVCRRQVP